MTWAYVSVGAACLVVVGCMVQSIRAAWRIHKQKARWSL